MAVYQPFRNRKDQAFSLEAIVFDGSGIATGGIQVVIPARAFRGPGLMIKIGDTAAMAYPIGLCEQRFCVIRAGLTKKQLAALRHSEFMDISYYHSGDPKEPEKMRIPLDGLAPALDELVQIYTRTEWPKNPADSQT